MNRIFDITTASERVSIGEDGRGEITFTVTNGSEGLLRGQLRVTPLGSTKGEWLNIAGETERAFSPNATQQVIVKIATPQGAPAGKYQFRLDAISVINPADDFTEGPTIDFEVKATEASKKAFPWRLIAATAALILIVGLTWWFWPRGATPKGETTVVVFEDNFDEAPKGAWSQTKAETAPDGKTKFLGQFGTDSVKLTLSDLPPHKTVTVNFDLYINNTWEGADSRDGVGPDMWALYQGEEDPFQQYIRGPNRQARRDAIFGMNARFLILTTFSNMEDRNQTFACENGAYTAPFCYFSTPGRATFGAAALNSLGFKNSTCADCRDSVYKIKRVFTHDQSQLILTFFSELREQLEQNKNTGNEGWGLDNVRIEVQ